MDTVGERSFFLKKKMLTKEKKNPLNAFVFDCYLCVLQTVRIRRTPPCWLP